MKQLDHGATFGSYRIFRTIGRGGMGVMYEASPSASDEPVALKVFHLVDARQRAMIEREMVVMEGLRHRGVAGMIELVEHEGVLGAAYEYISGPRMQEWQQTASVPELVAAYADTARALAHVHAQGVIHRDLKPSNVLMRSSEVGFEPVLTDFGFARSFAARDRLTQVGTHMVGTPLYLAPEVISGEEEGPRSDIYSFGVMLYEALGGDLHVEATHGLIHLVSLRSRGAWPDWDAARETLPAWSLSHLKRMLAVDPHARPTATQVADWLTHVWQGMQPPRPAPPVTTSWRRASSIMSSEKRARDDVDDVDDTSMPEDEDGAAASDSSDGTLDERAHDVDWDQEVVPEQAAFSILGMAAVVLAAAIVVLVATMTWYGSLGGTAGSTPWFIRLATPLFTACAAFAMGLVVTWWRRQRAEHALLAKAKRVEERIRLLEERLHHLHNVSESVAIEIDDVQGRLREDELAELVRESVVVALQDAAPKEPESELAAAIQIIADLAKPKPKPSGSGKPEPWHKRVNAWVGVGTALLTLFSGVLALSGNLGIWDMDDPPVVASVVADTKRVVIGKPVEFFVDATDPDGKVLSYTYEVNVGRIQGFGSKALWTHGQPISGPWLEMEVEVSDGRHTVQKHLAVRVNHPPEVTWSPPAKVQRGTRIDLRPQISDRDRDKVALRWRSRCGTLSQDDPLDGVLVADGHCARIKLRLSMDDGFEVVERSWTIDVEGAGTGPELLRRGPLSTP